MRLRILRIPLLRGAYVGIYRDIGRYVEELGVPLTGHVGKCRDI